MEPNAPTDVSTVNRIPQSMDKTMKRGCITTNDVSGGGGMYNTNSATKQHDSKRQKMEWDLEPFPKLNPIENTAHAQRITSRYKMILKGKNTIGYNVYCQQVPKHLRRIRSMDTPNTPDHTLDIPSKRWQGLVKAWRVALHKYDPPDLVSTTKLSSESDEDDGIRTTLTNSNTTPERIARCVSTAKKNHDHHPSASPTMEDSTPISMTEACPSSPFFDPMLTTTTTTPSRRALDFDGLDDVNNNDDSDDDLI